MSDTLQSEKLELPDRVWMRVDVLTSPELMEHFARLNPDDVEYVRAPIVAVQGDDVWCGNPACHFCRHRNLVPAAFAAPSPSSPVPAEQKHHKHCSSWTVNTSGERQPCDCVCACRHSMFEHIRPGEHYWYEDCAVEGCPCMKFAAATPASVEQDLIAALAWTVKFFRSIDSAGCSRAECARAREVATIIEKHTTQRSSPSPAAREAADEIDTLLVPLSEYAKTPGIEKMAEIITRCCSPVPAAGGDEGKSKVEQTIDGWRSQLTQDSFVSDEDAEDLMFRMLALFGGKSDSVGEEGK